MESMKVHRSLESIHSEWCMPMATAQMPIWLAPVPVFPCLNCIPDNPGFVGRMILSSHDVFAKFSFNLPFIGSHLSLFTIIWLVSTLVFTQYSTKDQDFQPILPWKYMQYLMPVVFVILVNSASGLDGLYGISNSHPILLKHWEEKHYCSRFIRCGLNSTQPN